KDSESREKTGTCSQFSLGASHLKLCQRQGKARAIVRDCTQRLPNRILSYATLRISRVQKQIYLPFAQANKDKN
ncbi:hypothetical protein, partial [Alistipes putredinis]|uniref:hypothetical protein n=1 Tax=Alistipes putredinis TaxID=28117 RepID=UPI00402A5371